MTTCAFVTTGASATRLFLGKRPAITAPRTLRPATTRRARCRLPTRGPTAALHEPDGPEALPHGFQASLEQFSLALLGAYGALGGAEAALAVPEALKEAFTSKPVSLAHPTLMWFLLGTCLYTFYLGYQSSLIRKSEPEKRKELVKAKVTDRHFQTSSALFATMTIATFTGMANTYARTDKLFPGPHLYAGLGLVATMSVMSSLVPYMQKGKNWARNAHFTIAFGAVALFGWQAKSGMAIVYKLLGWA